MVYQLPQKIGNQIRRITNYLTIVLAALSIEMLGDILPLVEIICMEACEEIQEDVLKLSSSDA